MSPCHCQCQLDQDTVLQSNIHAVNSQDTKTFDYRVITTCILMLLCAGADLSLNELSRCIPERIIPYPYVHVCT